MPIIKRGVGAGNRDSYLGFLDSTYNLFAGGTPTLPASGQASGMLELLGIKEVNLTVPEPDRVPDEGDDTVLATFDFDSSAVRAYIATLAVHDLQLDAYLQTTNLVQIGDSTWGAIDVLNAPEINCVLLHQSRAKKFDPSNRGQKAWEYVLAPQATARPLYRQTFAGKQVAVYRLAISINLPSRTPWGVTFTSDANNFGTDSTYLITGKGDNPQHIVAWQGNSILTDIPLDHVPINTTKTVAWSNRPGGSLGVPLTVSAVSPTAKTETVPALPIGTYGVSMYEYAKK